MKEFAKSLLTNRFGIVLGILNLCCIPLFSLFSFSSSTSIVLNYLLAAANSPAIILSIIIGRLLEAMFPVFNSMTTKSLFIPILILLQWVFIGYLSKTIAEKIRLNLSRF